MSDKKNRLPWLDRPMHCGDLLWVIAILAVIAAVILP